METIESLKAQGEALGYEGNALRAFVKDQQDRLRDERQEQLITREMEARERELALKEHELAEAKEAREHEMAETIKARERETVFKERCCCCFTSTVTSKVMSGWSVNLTTLFLGWLRPP